MDIKPLFSATQPGIALITGAGSPTGLGFAVAKQLAQLNSIVFITAHNEVSAKARAGELAAKGFKVYGIGLDVTDDAALAAMAKMIQMQYGGLDILVNNAGAFGQTGETASTADLAMTKEIFEVNVFGPWRTAQAFLPLMRHRPHARVVNVSSGAGSHGDEHFGLAMPIMSPGYGVSKAALNALTVKMAVEEKANGVLINAVCPGFCATAPGLKEAGARPVEEGAASVVWATQLPDGGSTGGFWRDGVAKAW